MMNKDNYATLEASKRLVDAGIVLETEKYWYQDVHGWYLGLTPTVLGKHTPKHISAPSPAEVLRELPEQTYLKKSRHFYLARLHDKDEIGKTASNTNPTDCLIDLLIWTVQQKKEGKDG
jgi:hypothetical protein